MIDEVGRLKREITALTDALVPAPRRGARREKERVLGYTQ